MPPPHAHGLLQQLIARDALARLADDVSGTGARLMPLKGVLLVALGVRKASDRPMADVDVLVEPHLAGRVVAAARARGWEAPTGNDAACIIVHPTMRSTSVDLHRLLFRPNIFAMDTAGVFARSALDERLFGRPMQRMHRLDLYAHLIGHFVKGRSDQRDLRHLRDFAAVGRWSGESPADCAAHLERLGLARAARYALRLSVAHDGDAFGAEVLRALRPDFVGRVITRVSSAALRRVAPGSPWGVPWVHALNTNVVRGAQSLLEHVAQPDGEDRSRDGWWRG